MIKNILIMILICFAGAALAKTTIEVQRELFLIAEKKILEKNFYGYNSYRHKLRDYPLFPYLEALKMSHNITKLNQKDIDNFNMNYPGTLASYRLQTNWLNELVRKKRWQQYLIAQERSDIYSNQFQCLRALALYKTKQIKLAWQETATLWRVGYSQNKACDIIFSLWKKSTQFNQQLAIERFWLAVQANNITLAKYINTLLTSPKLKQQTQLFWHIHHNPQEIINIKPQPFSNYTNSLIYIHAIKKWAKKELLQATDFWLRSHNKYALPAKKKAQITQWFALKFAKNFHPDAVYYIPKLDPFFDDPIITQWRIRLALAEQNWSQVMHLINRLPHAHRSKNRWRYWQAVAYSTLAQQKTTKNLMSLHQASFQLISQSRDFYGFLVADLNNQPFMLNKENKQINKKNLQILNNTFSAFGRMREWVKLNRPHRAQSVLNKMQKSLTTKQRKLFAYLAQKWGWYNQAIYSAAKTALWDDIPLRFPSPFSQTYAYYAKKNKLNYIWSLAISRQESAFNSHARSHAGALGLMQLMPTTAKEVAQKHKIPYKNKQALYNPHTNISLGSAYLSDLLKRFNGNKILATAAYNAGPSRVSRWQKMRGHLPLDIWIETIPFDETRQYVQNVLAFSVIYNNLHNINDRMLSSWEAALVSISPWSPRTLPTTNLVLSQYKIPSMK